MTRPLTPDDPRHGTNGGYIAHCYEGTPACGPCKAAHAEARRRYRVRRYLARGPLMVPALGTQRRIQALVALGWTMQELDNHLGRSQGYLHNVLRNDRVHTATAALVSGLYDRLCMVVPQGVPGVRTRQRNRARARGWAPPLAWDDIDDPTERPQLRHDGPRRRVDVDPVVVERLLAGERVPCTHAERVAVVEHYRATGRPLAELEHRFGWKPERYGQPRGQVAS